MYEGFYSLKEKPFSLLPDPGFLYLSKQHQMALVMLEYGLTSQAGFSVITGGIGTGKTTLIRHLLNQIDRSTTVGLITNTHRTFGELLHWISMAFGLDHAGKDKVALYQTFVDFLIREYARRHRTVLIVDEAQNMSADTLEELRMLSNINADKNQVLQVILVGQAGLRDLLRRPDLEQFAQRIAVDYHLKPLGLAETAEYVRHRLVIAGGSPGIFDSGACEAIFHYSGGTPRLINLLCDTALVYGFAEQSKVIGRELVEDVAREKQQGGIFPSRSPVPPTAEAPTARADTAPAPKQPMPERTAAPAAAPTPPPARTESSAEKPVVAASLTEPEPAPVLAVPELPPAEADATPASAAGPIDSNWGAAPAPAAGTAEPTPPVTDARSESTPVTVHSTPAPTAANADPDPAPSTEIDDAPRSPARPPAQDPAPATAPQLNHSTVDKALKVAVAADAESERAHLAKVLEACGIQVVAALPIDIGMLDKLARLDVDVLLVNLDENAEEELANIDDLLAQMDIPVLLNDSAATRASMTGALPSLDRKLVEKLIALVERHEAEIAALRGGGALPARSTR